jgi:hypothetical protein
MNLPNFSQQPLLHSHLLPSNSLAHSQPAQYQLHSTELSLKSILSNSKLFRDDLDDFAYYFK